MFTDVCWPFVGDGHFASGPDDIRGKVFKKDAPKTLWKWSHEGFLYNKLDDNKVVCGICPHRCILAPGDRSVCRSRVNIDGKLYSLTYGNPCAVHNDPVEKKPLFHFRPGSMVFSLATTGCNFRCLNWYNLWISNGYINQGPLLELCKVLDGANINLKSYSDEIYRKLNGGRLQPVLNTLKTLHEQKVHFEVTTLLVPGYIDDEEMIKQMCGWILDNLGADHPLHFLRFFPKYKLDRLPPTPVSTLTRFRELAIKEGIRYVYVGNVPNHEGNNTYCHNCSKLLIERQGYFLPTYNLTGNKCKFCDAEIPGVWN